MRKNSPGMNDVIAIAREVMLQHFLNGDQQMAKDVEHVWNKLITTRNCMLARKYNSSNVIDFPLAACE